MFRFGMFEILFLAFLVVIVFGVALVILVRKFGK